MAPDRIRSTVAEARRHAELALKELGDDAEEAAIIADNKSMPLSAATNIRDWQSDWPLNCSVE
jgi:hypothetical protein